jgi:hypothetical protein
MSLLDELRVQYEAARSSSHAASEVPDFQQVDAQMRKAFRWLEKAVAYLDELKPPVAHRFEVFPGAALESPRFGRGYVGQHERRIVGYPVLDEINIYYEIAAAQPLVVDATDRGLAAAEAPLDQYGLQYTAHCVEDHAGALKKCTLTVMPSVPAAVTFHVDYQRGTVDTMLSNVDRLDRVRLEFKSNALDEPALEDLVRLMLGRSSSFLHRAPLAGIRGQPS